MQSQSLFFSVGDANAGNNFLQELTDLRLSPPGTSALARRRRGSVEANLTSGDGSPVVFKISATATPQQSCSTAARLVTSGRGTAKTTLGFGLKSIQGT